MVYSEGMKSIFAILIILALVYFGVSALNNSSTVSQTRQSDMLDEYGLSDLKGDVSDGTHGAIIDMNTGIQGFFQKINDTINDARDTIHNVNSSANVSVD